MQQKMCIFLGSARDLDFLLSEKVISILKTKKKVFFETFEISHIRKHIT